jgi:hypothetical protein
MQSAKLQGIPAKASEADLQRLLPGTAVRRSWVGMYRIPSAAVTVIGGLETGTRQDLLLFSGFQNPEDA